MKCYFCVYLFVFLLCLVTFTHEEEIRPELVSGWAAKLGAELWNLGDYVTRRGEVMDSFKEVKVESRDGAKIVNDLAKEIENMMSHKIAAVKRIVETAENAAMDSKPDEDVDPGYEYYNAKMLESPGSLNKSSPEGEAVKRELLLTSNSHFYDIAVNTSVSSVHVPTNVFDRAREVIHAIKWSDRLEFTFKDNYKNDPSLSWQYFGSSTGFMRQFPAMAWATDPVDLYDCRTRSWYIEAATSPKDILILVDNSGSMMGQRKEIARHVVNSILDTLGNNDFVNIISFVNETKEVVECYKDMLVQANLENIRELKLGMKQMEEAKYIANFSTALITAFDILQQYRESRIGAACNQAIMLITDGVPYNFKEIFEMYNWKTLPHMPVRVFTYLLGKEVADVREVKWMACANRGYYVHLSTMAEVREQVLQYVPVMARPMVLQREVHPIIWTPVYADITDPTMTDWLWDLEECKEQKQRSMSFRKDRQKFMEPEELEKRNIRKLRRIQDESAGDTKKYRFMTSVSMPVFDNRETAMKVAYLLGVAGTDVPLEEIIKLLKPHWLGVNAYAFITTNNGYILVHPDLRPVFQGILKPNYNSVDITDVEMMDDEFTPLEFNPQILEFREKLVGGKINSSTSMRMKQHLDNMKRVIRGIRYYYYEPIFDSPFTLVVSLPDHYGRYQIDAVAETHLMKSSKGKFTFFDGKNWRVHPNWLYCKYRMETDETPKFNSLEEEVVHFFSKTQSAGWNWPSRYPNDILCDRNLFLSLVFDAKVTAWFTKNVSATSAEDKGKEFKQRFGLTLVFLATRSGLTRWQDFPDLTGREETTYLPHFKDIHNKAIDEVWYRRAVDQNMVDREKFVYSVPFSSGLFGAEITDKNDTLVTASNAIFIEAGDKKAPVAVVGFQFQHSALHNLFINITSSCMAGSSSDNCKETQTCASDSFECYVLDSNAYIILSENKEYTGYFFGEVRGYIMDKLVSDNVYHKVRMFDYQGVCFVGEKTDSSDSTSLKNPLHYLSWLANWIIAHLVWSIVEFNFHWVGSLAYSFQTDNEVSDGTDYSIDDEEEEEVGPTVMMPSGENNIKDAFGKVMINRTRPAPCTKEVNLYQLAPKTERKDKSREPGRHCEPPYVVQSISHSDMILVVVHASCPSASDPHAKPMNVIPSEFDYNGTSLNCHKIKFKHKMPRRRPPSCIKEHIKEEDIKLCGRGVQLTNSVFVEITCLLIFTLIYSHSKLS